MIEARHSLTCDPVRNVIYLTVAGFFSVAEVERLQGELHACYAKLRCAPNQHLTLVDASGMKIQTQEVVAAFLKLANQPQYRARRLAIVVGSSLSRLQAQRVTERTDVEFFRDPDDARRWLLSAG